MNRAEQQEMDRLKKRIAYLEGVIERTRNNNAFIARLVKVIAEDHGLTDEQVDAARLKVKSES
jgi:16S rRNA G527 N7-methylase RsmG